MNFWQLFRFRTFCAQLGEKNFIIITDTTSSFYWLEIFKCPLYGYQLEKIWIVHPFQGNYLRGIKTKVVRPLCSNKFWLIQSPSSYPTPWKTSADFSKFLLYTAWPEKIAFYKQYMLTLFMRLKASPKKSFSCDFITIIIVINIE